MWKRFKLWLRRRYLALRGGGSAPFGLSVREDITLDDYERALLTLGLDPDEPLTHDDLRNKARVADLDTAERFIKIVTGKSMGLRKGYTLEAARQIVAMGAALFFTQHTRPNDRLIRLTRMESAVQDLHPLLKERLSRQSLL